MSPNELYFLGVRAVRKAGNGKKGEYYSFPEAK